jgi:hypothetical protein
VWADNLFRGIDVKHTNYGDEPTVDSGLKAKEEITIQVDGGFQNTYIFAERQPLTLQQYGAPGIKVR